MQKHRLQHNISGIDAPICETHCWGHRVQDTITQVAGVVPQVKPDEAGHYESIINNKVVAHQEHRLLQDH